MSLVERYISELLRILSESLLQGSSGTDVSTSSVADIQTGLNDLIAGLNDFDCSRLDGLLFKSSQDPSAVLSTEDARDGHSRTLSPERYFIRRDFHGDPDGLAAPHSTVDRAELNYGVVTPPCHHGEVVAKGGHDATSRRSSQGSSRGSLVRRVWIEGEMEREEKQVVSERVDEEGEFKVTQRVRMTRHFLPITEIVEFVGKDSIRVSELCSRRVVEVNVEEEVDICQKMSRSECDGESSLQFCENVKERTAQGRHRVSIHSRSSSLSESSSDDLAVSGDLLISPHILTDIEVTAELLPGKSLKTRRIVRTRSSSLPSFE